MPFQKGHPPYTNGRPRKGESLKELLNQVGVEKKRDLVKVAYEYALAGNVQWADWIARHSGEGSALLLEVQHSAGWDAFTSEVMAKLGYAPPIEGEARVLPAIETSAETA